MILSAPILTTLQRCERRFRLESEYRVLRHRPKELFDRLLRQAVYAISNGKDPREVAEEAVTVFLETAARPGLDVLADPYTLAQDYCAIFRTYLEALSREAILCLRPGGTVTVGEHQWQVESYRDDSGVLHRWTSVEKWNSDAAYRELHSWHVFGDCAATGQGMWLHVVEIGRNSNGHQNTPWCRCYKHPAIASHFRFAHTDGGALQGNWKPVYYQDSDDNDPKTWVDLMTRDRVTAHHHIQIREPHPEHLKEFRRDVAEQAKRMAAVGPRWDQITRERPACDIPPCPWQPVCFGPPGPIEVGNVGGFVSIK